LGWGLFGGLDSQEFVKMHRLIATSGTHRPDARERWPW